MLLIFILLVSHNTVKNLALSVMGLINTGRSWMAVPHAAMLR